MLRKVTVHFEDGNQITTSIIGTNKEIEQYYIGNQFQFGDTMEHPEDKLVRAVGIVLYP